MREQILKVLRESGSFVSGQELSSRLNVSRTAVWKAVNQLKEAGYEIEAVQNRGYRLAAAPDVLSAEELSSIRRTAWLGEKIYFYRETDSTNTRARSLAEDGAGHGTVVVAEIQNAGRGRRGRQWTSPEGAGVWFTILLKPDIRPDDAAMLTLVAAMAVARGIERTAGKRPQIKWPNDVVLSGKKVCGILTEMSTQIDYVNHIVVGIGVNVKPQAFPAEIAEKATALETECGKSISRPQLLEAVLEEFEHFYGLYMETMDVSLFMEEYNSFLVNKGRQVKVLDPAGAYEGTALGINGRGELLVERQGEVVTVNSGEVSVRGIYGYV